MLKIILSIVALYLAVRLLRENQSLRRKVEKNEEDGNLIEGEVVDEDKTKDEDSK